MFSIHINKLWNSSGGAQKAYPRVPVFPPIHKDGTQLVDHMSITISTHHPPPPLHHSRLWEQIDAHEIAPLERFTCQTNILAPERETERSIYPAISLPFFRSGIELSVNLYVESKKKLSLWYDPHD